jgi:DNA-binding transcriptional LysR family regulator
LKLQVLKYFTVLAEELHFGRAAAKLAVTQPPLSMAIKALEEELGVVLFQRTKARVQLTPAGSAFLIEARKVLECVSRAKSVVMSIDQGITGRLDIGFGGTLIFRDILRIVDAFNREYPGIEVVLHEMQSSEQVERLLHGQLDAGFNYGSVSPPHLETLTLNDDTFVLCVHENHPAAAERAVNLRDLTGEHFIMFARDVNPVNHDNIVSILSRAGIYLRCVHHTRNWMTTVALVSAGCGMAIVPSSLERMRMSSVRFIPLSGEHVSAPAVLAWNPSLVSPALQNFIESAKTTLQAMM